MFTMLTSLSKNDVITLAKTGKCYNIENMTQISEKMLNSISTFMEKNIGYKSIPVCCVSVINGQSVTMNNNYEDIDDYLEVGGGSILLELYMKPDMCVSIEFDKLLSYNKKFRNCSEYEEEFLLEDFYEELQIGRIEGNDVITFIPFLDIKTARWFLVLNENWDTEHMELGNVKQFKVNKMEAFQ